MKFRIEHEIKGRIRAHLYQKRMSDREADTLLYYLRQQEFVTSAKVYGRTQDVVICFRGDRLILLEALRSFSYEATEVPASYLDNSSRRLGQEYWEKLISRVLLHYGNRLFVPLPLRSAITAVKSVKYIWKGLCSLTSGRIEVPVLDGMAIGVSVFRSDFATASSVMFLLGIGEILEDWTHKKSVADLARSMSLNVHTVWLLKEGQEILVSSETIEPGDQVVVHMGNRIPFDGVVTAGEAMVNQASLTGESLPVKKEAQSYVYAGTVVEEGELTILVRETKGSTKFEKIVAMIEETEKLKSSLESQAEHLADRLVPYTLTGTALTYLLTRNVTKALSVLMVDFSCALKLAMPISVLSAIREASFYHITVKGGRFLEAAARADTIVFDKTGTLTKAEPTVAAVIPFTDTEPDELLKLAACMEEHFPHSMAKAVVEAARKKGLEHEEMHSRVNYIVAHGISTTLEGKKAIIGSHHFVFEDEGCKVPEEYQERFENLPPEYSHLFMGLEGKLVAVICIEDPLRKEAPEVIRVLRTLGFSRIVMMTGDSQRAAGSVAQRVGVDEYYSEVLPEDKAHFVEQEKEAGHTVLMLGDGINDSPALSAADVGIAICQGAELAREIADITIEADSLYELVLLKQISDGLMKRIRRNYRSIVTINGALIALGVLGILPPATSALFHNASTLMISLKSMGNLLEETNLEA